MKANETRKPLTLRENCSAQLNHEPPNNALNPTFLRVTALANGSKRRAARHAGERAHYAA